MRLSSLVIGIVLIGTLMVGFYQFVNDMTGTDGYDITVDSSYEEAFDHSNNISEDINSRYEAIQNLSANTESTVGVITLVPQVLIIAKNMVVLPFSIVGGMITSITFYMGLPAWVGTFLLTIITILLVFGLVALILRYKYT